MPAGVAKLSIAALKRTISRAGLSTDGLIERRELEEAATRALQILEERWRGDEPNCQYYGGCAFRREQLQDMLRDFKRRKQPDRGYNLSLIHI